MGSHNNQEIKKHIEVQKHGVRFGYYINTSNHNPLTEFIKLESCEITNEQKTILKNKCNCIKFG